MVWACSENFQASMSSVEQQLQNWFTGWVLNWINTVSVRFLDRKCFIQRLFSSDYSMDHCFNDKLQQQNSGSSKLCMHGKCQYFDWMVFVMKIFRLLAESGRNKQKCAWANCLSTSIGSLIWQDALRTCFISFYVCYPRPWTQEIWLSCLLQWNFEPDRQNFDVSILDV